MAKVRTDYTDAERQQDEWLEEQRRALVDYLDKEKARRQKLGLPDELEDDEEEVRGR